MFNSKNSEYSLLKAVKENQFETAKKLLAEGAKTTCTSENNNGVLHHAVMNKNPDMIALLLQNGADISKENLIEKTPIQFAAASKSWDCVIAFAENRKVTNNNGRYDYALLKAVEDNQLAVAQALLEAGAKTTCTDRNDNDVLLHAVFKRNPDMIALLLQHGADISKRSNGVMPIQLAADDKSWDCVIAFARNRKVTNNNGRYDYALLKAVEDNQLDVAQALLEAGAETTCASGYYGNSVLHHAVFKDNPDMIALLLKYHADVTKLNNYGRSARWLASDLKLWDCVKVFADPRSSARYLSFTSKIEAKIIIIQLLLAQKDPNNIFGKLSLDLIGHICKFIPVVSDINVNKFAQSFYITSAKVYCEQHNKFWIFSRPGIMKSPDSEKFSGDLKKIIANESSPEEKYKQTKQEVEKFVVEKRSNEKRTVDLLTKYHLVAKQNTNLEKSKNNIEDGWGKISSNETSTGKQFAI